MIITIIMAILAFVGGYFIRKYLGEAKIKSAEDASKKVVEEAKREAENKKKEILIEAKDQAYATRSEAEKEAKERRYEIVRLEKRIAQKEESIDKKLSEVMSKEKEFERRQQKLDRQEQELSAVYEKEKQQLEQIAGLSIEQAKDLLVKRVEEDIRHDIAVMTRDLESAARDEAEEKARNIISLAIQRFAGDHVAETTVSVVHLPSDDVKGRIIGREGRNIRAFENLTGINLIIDDTPEAVILSGFDPVRREIARLTLEKLITDGRIQPARIEDIYKKTKQEVETEIRKAGEKAALDTGVRGIHPELLRVLGRLKYRTSYGQNVLQHSTEVAYLAGIMAAELGTDVTLAKRAGLLHDLGKAIDHEVEGPHALIGADLAKRLKESRQVCHAIESHHDEVDPKTVEAVLVKAGDAVSSARPGARRENLENYVKRLENLEHLAEEFKGVGKAYAVQAGREIRIMVNPEAIDDAECALLAKDIAKKIEEDLEYPGQIKVTVIRENRTVEYAK
ncbi:MAG: ribonuclease Y [Actinobacteria bacterium]|nr:MAG: ribonuclease Y [Actinomycetota bacterium]